MIVKSAFDLYRSDLLKQLGYPHKFPGRDAERRLWRDISVQMEIGTPRSNLPRHFIRTYPANLQTFVRTVPDNISVEVTRGIKALPSPLGDKITMVSISVKNVARSQAVVESMVITDLLPEASEYEWGSALASVRNSAAIIVGTRHVSVTGMNPYEFKIDGSKLRYQEEINLNYYAIRRDSK